MKPIEPGCMAILYGLVNDTNLNGRVVRVIYLHNDGTSFFKERLWRTSGHGAKDLSFEKNLLRIDDYDPSQDFVVEDLINRIVTIEVKLA